MNLIEITANENNAPTVSGRELHGMLEIETRYNDWFSRMCEYGFSEGDDYYSILSNRSDGLPGKPRIDHYLTIDMAKEICMLQRTEKGKQVRQYFIQLEQKWNSPEAVMARALKMANQTLEQVQTRNQQLQADNSKLTVENTIMQPKAEYFDTLVDHGGNTGIRETAKVLNIPEKQFVKQLIEKHYLYRDQSGKLMPYAKHLSSGTFVLKESVNEKTGWTGTQLLITPKGKEKFNQMFVG